MGHLTTAELAAVEETPVWLEINRRPAVTWMCTPDQLEELVVGWLHGEGYIATVGDIRSLRPCATDLGFGVEIDEARLAVVNDDDRRRVLASGCGAVSVALADPASLPRSASRGGPAGARRRCGCCSRSCSRAASATRTRAASTPRR